MSLAGSVRGRSSGGLTPATSDDHLPKRIALRDAAPYVLTLDQVFGSEREGHAICGGGVQQRRTTAVFVVGPEDEIERLDRLLAMFRNPDFLSAQLVLAMLHDVAVDHVLGFCSVKSGQLITESAAVALAIEPSLESSPLVGEGAAVGPPRSVIEGPILHCFHRSAPAYGHFILDGLVTLAKVRDDLLRAGGKVLLPPFMPGWSLDMIRALGFPDDAIFRPAGRAARYAKLVVASCLDTSMTFRPDGELCAAPRLALSPTGPAHRLIYLSRANQTSYSQRRLVNEDAVRALLVSRGFEIFEPGNLTIKEQACAIGEAAVVVGLHGSTFGNLVFARPDTVVIDLMPADWVGYWRMDPPAERWLLNLTTALRLRYGLVLCNSVLVRLNQEDDWKGLQKFGMDVTVDLTILSRALDRVQAKVH